MTQVCGELTGSKSQGYDGLSQTELDNGGMKVITTINLSMEEEMYKAVNENIAQIKNTSGATVTTLPPWALIGAELQDPKTGQIIAEYPGRGESPGHGVDTSAAKCKTYDCNINTITSREQVGSSFKPYVLSTAVSEGMDVQNSIMNSSTYLCIPPAAEPAAVLGGDPGLGVSR